MKRFIHVHTNEVMAGKNNSILKSDANRACLVIAAYDAISKVGALAHSMFTCHHYFDKKTESKASQETAFALDEMIKDMTVLGANKEDINVCLVTGENIPHTKDDPEYNQGITTAIKIIRDKHLKLDKTTTTDIGNQHVSLDVATGQLMYE